MVRTAVVAEWIHSTDLWTLRMRRAKIEWIKTSIEVHGFTNPIDLRIEADRLTIVDGRHRIIAALELGIERIPAKILPKPGREPDGAVVDRTSMALGHRPRGRLRRARLSVGG